LPSQSRRAFTACLCLWLFLPCANAASQDSTRIRTAVAIQVDNDLFAIRGAGPPPDYDYTHGTRLSLALPNGFAARSGTWVTTICLGQEIYTPRHDSTLPIAGDRPYAAWIYLGASIARLAGQRLDSLGLRLGVTGPPALGEELQNGVHRLLHNRLERGWSHQLPARLVAAANYDAARMLIGDDSFRTSRFVSGGAGATLGTLRREVHAGLESYWGFGKAQAPTAAKLLVRRPGRWYLAAGYRQAFVAHDTFIEGGAGVPGAARIPWVAEAFAATGVRVGRFLTEYRYVVRGREYRAEPNSHAYGSISISMIAR
jgi:hypothetical protein